MAESKIKKVIAGLASEITILNKKVKAYNVKVEALKENSYTFVPMDVELVKGNFDCENKNKNCVKL